jgi:hypothetical protein
MSNSQRRTQQRHRRKRRPGLHNPAVKEAQAYVADLGVRTHQRVVELREAALAEQRRQENAVRAIPVSGGRAAARRPTAIVRRA